ncbi:MAG: OmpA family protein [Thiotrichaceae bacterium]|nr:OmpA family protein [Thiotrichaceae bacterium]
MPTIVRITILSLILVLEACSSFRFNSHQAFITSGSFRSQPELPIVTARLLTEPLKALPITPLSIEPPIIPDVIENILFDSDSSVLSSLAVTQLDNFANVVGSGDYQILLEGHTDSSHNYEYNQNLSEARASAVKEALIARGILSSRLITDYHGETNAVATNSNSQGKQQNRRVELRPIKPFKPKPLLPKALSLAPTDTSLKPLSAATNNVEVIDIKMNSPKKLEPTANATIPININLTTNAPIDSN